MNFLDLFIKIKKITKIEKIEKIIKKTTLLEKLVFILLICLLIVLIKNYTCKKEGFTNNTSKEFIIKSGLDIYDDYYTGVYDDLVYNKVQNNYEIGTIINNTNPTLKSKILDIGCGTGHHVNVFSKQNIHSIIGIDISKEMIKKAQGNYPECNFRLCDALNTLEFTQDSFTHIICLNFTIYYIKNKRQILKNCYDWLMPGGVLVIHLVNSKLFDAINPIIYKTGIKPSSKSSLTRLTKSNAEFNTFDYKSDFKLNENTDSNTCDLNEPNAIFKESFKFNDSNTTRINEHQLYMPTQKSILNIAKKIGFIIKSQHKMTDAKYREHYLYLLEKP